MSQMAFTAFRQVWFTSRDFVLVSKVAAFLSLYLPVQSVATHLADKATAFIN